MQTKYKIGETVYTVLKSNDGMTKKDEFELYIQKLTIEKIELQASKNCYGMVIGASIEYSFKEISEHYKEEKLLPTLEEAIEEIKNIFE